MISLFVARSPNIVAGGGGGHLLDSVDVAVGGTVRLECRAEGIPKPKVTWRVFKRNGQKRKSNFSEYGYQLNRLYLHHCTGYGLKDGSNKDNFAMLWNIDKIFGMFEDLIATNRATS